MLFFPLFRQGKDCLLGENSMSRVYPNEIVC